MRRKGRSDESWPLSEQIFLHFLKWSELNPLEFATARKINYNVTTMLFMWDPGKARANIKKHGISFDLAATVFQDPLHLSVLDGKDRGEERWVTIGVAGDSQTLVVVHLYREIANNEVVRIISARRATKKEKKQYEEGI
jgi:hypothetical protein